MLTGGLRAARLRSPPAATTLLFAAAICTGSVLGALSPEIASSAGPPTDAAIGLLVGALFFTIRWEGFSPLRRAPRTVALALGMNFLLIPALAVVLTLVLPNEALRIGVLIYCLAPCTDWFLGFTRLAGGDTAVGAALIPIQMTLQLALYPVWLSVFAGQDGAATFANAGPTLLTWFVTPAAIALALRLAMSLVLPARLRESIVGIVDAVIPAIIALVIVGLFAGNVETILAAPGSFAWVLAVVFVFFVCTYVLGEAVSRVFRLKYPEHALLTMTTSARNAPLMLAVTTIALPDQPAVYAAIVLGMLIEFPHLTAITHLLRRKATAAPAAQQAPQAA